MPLVTLSNGWSEIMKIEKLEEQGEGMFLNNKWVSTVLP